MIDFGINVREFVKIQEEVTRLDCCNNTKDYSYIKEKIDQYFLTSMNNGKSIFSPVISLLKSHPSNHGDVYFDGHKKMTLYEHTLDFLFGLVNGTGLQVDVGSNNEIYSQATIIAGLYHDSGKSVSRHMHEERAGTYIDHDLSFYPVDNTDLLKDLIFHEGMFFNFDESIEEIISRSKRVIKLLSDKHGIEENVMFRMLCSMFIADSTTMRRVYKMNEEYIDYTFDHLSERTIDDIDELVSRFSKDPYA